MRFRKPRNALINGQAESFLMDTRSGSIIRSIDNADSDCVTYVLKTRENTHYCALLNKLDHPYRNALLQLSMALGLPVSINANCQRFIDVVSVGLKHTRLSETSLFKWNLLNDVRTGLIVQIDDADSLGTFGYILRCPDGSHYCAQMTPDDNRNRHMLMLMAFRSGLPVTIRASADYYVTGVSIGSLRFGPNIECTAEPLGNTPRTGFIEEIIDTETCDRLGIVLKSVDGARYHARLERRPDAEKLGLMIMAVGAGLPLTVYGNEYHYITGLSIGTYLAEETPPLICFSLRLTETRTGFLTRIIDYDMLDRVNYLLRAWDGRQYCVQMNAKICPHRHHMLVRALAWGLPVSITADVNSVVTGVAVGLPRAGSPSFHCGDERHAGTKTGNVTRLIDANCAGDQPSYVLQTPDGMEWRVQTAANADANRNALLEIALTSGLSVTIDDAGGRRSAGRLSVERR
ncbi:hypothetical protein [Caballeronia sp. GAWG1-1]|uniref:hypothetical protein n=1 Tax=Caballeronia sp. GAWG1-1 TaxID=2921742 RepID=UPI00202829C5|nr:hypothetical protein [Caballeronia sp. GAWG1-1]